MKKFLENAYLRYLSSYIIILVLPLLVLGITAHWFFSSVYIQETLEKNLNIPKQIQMAVDMQVTQLDRFVYQAKTDQAFSRRYLKGNPLPLQISKTLFSYNVNNQFVDNMFYYGGRVGDLYYGSGGSYDPEILFESILQYSTLTEQDFEKFAKGGEIKWIVDPALRTRFNLKTSYVTYVRPVYNSNSWNTNALILFFIDTKSFGHVIGAAEKNHDVINIVTNNEGEVLYRSSDFLSKDNTKNLVLGFETMQDSSVEGWKIADLEATDVYVNRKESDTGLVYLTLMPKDVMLQSTNRLQLIFTMIYSIVVTFGFLLAFIISRYYYNPVKKLKECLQFQGSLSTTDIITMAEDTIRSLGQSSLEYRKEHMLLELLQENNLEVEQLKLKDAGVFLNGPFYQCAIIWARYVSNEVQEQSNQEIRLLLQRIFSKGEPCYAIKYMERNCFILIFSKPSAAHEVNPNQLLDDLAALQEKGMEATLYLGNVYSNLKLLHQSFHEARIAFINRRKNDEAMVSYQQALDAGSTNHQAYPQADLEALCAAIRDEDIMMVEFLSKQVLNVVEQGMQNSFMARCICYEAINKIFQASEEKETGWMQSVSGDIAANLSFSSLEDLVVVFKSVCSRIILELNEKPNIKRRLGMKDALQYIDTHCCDMDFSVKALAMDYGMAISNFSHQFKNYTGKTVSEYINRRKIDYAKQLLMGGRSITEVADKAGYLHTSSFIRKFKQEVGMTPGEFQEQSKNQY